MKTMTCKQLGGACDKTFTQPDHPNNPHADTFDEIVTMSKLESWNGNVRKK